MHSIRSQNLHNILYKIEVRTHTSSTRSPAPIHDFHAPSDRGAGSQQIHQESTQQPSVDTTDRCAAAAAGCGLGLVVDVDAVVGSWWLFPALSVLRCLRLASQVSKTCVHFCHV